MLRGQNTDKIRKFRHERLSTFGIGAEFSDQQWRSIFRQLVVRGYLSVDHNRYGALCLTASSRELLRGETELLLREEPDKPKRSRTREKYTLQIEDEDLMEDLKALRAELAQAQGVPPYVVFHDATLVEMIQARPADHTALLEVTGVGQAKLQKYGDAFLAVLAKHQP